MFSFILLGAKCRWWVWAFNQASESSWAESSPSKHAWIVQTFNWHCKSTVNTKEPLKLFNCPEPGDNQFWNALQHKLNRDQQQSKARPDLDGQYRICLTNVQKHRPVRMWLFIVLISFYLNSSSNDIFISIITIASLKLFRCKAFNSDKRWPSSRDRPRSVQAVWARNDYFELWIAN